MSFRSYISAFLRKTHLLSTAETIRFYIQKWRYRKGNIDFKNRHPNFILPPDFFIYETYRLNLKEYHDEGKNSAYEIVSLLSKYFDLSKPGTKILDWGCGPGRVIQHLPSLLPKAEIYGTDYNGKYIQWCMENFPAINFSRNSIDPPMTYKDSFFNLIFGLSIFTHLSEKNHHDWVNELYRIAKSGGGVFITTQGRGYYSKLTANERKVFDSNNLVTRTYSNEGNRLYSAFQPFEFVKKLLDGKFIVLEYMAGKEERDEPVQDIWVLQKV